MQLLSSENKSEWTGESYRSSQYAAQGRKLLKGRVGTWRCRCLGGANILQSIPVNGLTAHSLTSVSQAECVSQEMELLLQMGRSVSSFFLHTHSLSSDTTDTDGGVSNK